MNSRNIAQYIISFLLREEGLPGALSEMVGYTTDPAEMLRYKVVIVPSGFFETVNYGHAHSLPPIPPKMWGDTPLLYGDPVIERKGPVEPILLYADIVASTYFLISRFEEMYYRDVRDRFGRFPGKESYPYKANFIHRPIIEEYGDKLRELLRESGAEVPDSPQGFSRVNLTHDIDCPYEYHGLRSFMRAWFREGKPLLTSYRLAFRNVMRDRFWTFPRFLEWNKELTREIPDICRTHFFYKTPGKSVLDRPNYRVSRYPVRKIHALAEKYHVAEGLHIPVSASDSSEEICRAKKLLERDLGKSTDKARYHFLMATEPENYLFLEENNIFDDYTMGYADISGFRLGTSRPVRFILPTTGEITRITMHPLTLMDVSLDRGQYMDLGEKEAFNYALALLEQVALHGGELNLLFHNDSLAKEVHPFHSRLYRELLRDILRLQHRFHPKDPEESTPSADAES